MRQTNEKNQIWFEQQDQVTRIGFTRDFLNSLDMCWHILPGHLEQFREKSPLLTIETNDALISIVSPVKGHFMEFSDKAQNFPNKLTEQDVVLQLQAQPREGVRGQPAQPGGINEMIQRMRAQQQEMAAAARPPQGALRARVDAAVQGNQARWIMNDLEQAAPAVAPRAPRNNNNRDF